MPDLLEVIFMLSAPFIVTFILLLLAYIIYVNQDDL